MTIKQARSRVFILVVFLSCLSAAHFSFSISSIQISFDQLEMLEQLIRSEAAPATNKKKAQPDAGTDFLKNLKLEQLNVEIDLAATPIKLTIDLSQLDLPPPYKNISNLNVTCPDLLLEESTINCNKGHIIFNGLLEPSLTSSEFSLTYNILTSDLKFSLAGIKVGQGTLAIEAQIKEQKWHAGLTASKVNFKYLKPYLHHYLFKNKKNNTELLENTGGFLSLTAKASGILALPENKDISWVQSVHISGYLKDVKYQYDENIADKVSLRFNTKIKQAAKKLSPMIPSDIYRLSVNIDKVKGEIFQNNIYVVPNGKEKISAQLTYYPNSQSINFSHFNLASGNIFEFKAKGNMALKNKFLLNRLDAQINFIDLAQFNKVYLMNIFSDTDYEGFEFEGAFKGKIKLNKDKIKLNTQFKDFSMAFNEQFTLIDLNGDVYWNNYNQNKLPVPKSQLGWQELTLNQLPLSQVKLNFTTHHDYLKLNKQVDIPLFDGALHINSLEIAQMLTQLPDNFKLKDKLNNNLKNKGLTLTIDGYVKPVSLELLSRHFDWPLLDGSLSAVIPSTTYNEKYLKVGGALMMQVFDGTIIVKDLEIVEPLKDYAQLSANIDLNNLNLQSLTKTYNFGEIQGRVEGKLSRLELSAWQPVAFDAYIRTPEKDKSKHKISQRAIDNLSSLGGASGILSRSFLRFFETFRYDKIGLSCKLKNNICLMSGVEAKGDSYYIVKGGGIPRIDVMGYQRHVNWRVLTSRLKAIQHANEVIVE